ncbi:MAG: 1-acyl-sn-glycerol-3-phosphate acyltransferase [Chloroflexi bacterium]|nr:1-acyl-sn-glycerol-3-phosphate acyltransferase [Chloroflexota bacterium]
MGVIRGVVRLLTILLLIALGTIVILATAWIPIKVRGIRMGPWTATFMARFILWLLRVKVEYHNVERFVHHQGFVFPNHVSTLDAVIIMGLMPMRFLSKAEIRNWPFIGWIARGIGTVFVDRSNKDSRENARKALEQVDHFPSIVLFPEGGIFPPPDVLKPFRYGAFEIAKSGSVPFLPCVLIYEQLDLAYWDEESIFSAIWELASYGGEISAHCYALRPVVPTQEDDAKELALEAHGAMDAILRYGGRESDVLQSGL